METPVRHTMPIGLAVLGLMLYASVAYGGGFQVTELSARQQGTRNAGAAAIAEDASTVFFNPAGMTRLKKLNVEADTHVIFPSFKFSDRNSTNAIGGVPQGKRNDDGGVTAVVPNFYITSKITDRIWAGLGVNVPYGLITEYNNDWIGRYNAIKSDLLTINFNPAVAYKVNDLLSIGAGLNAQYADAELTNAVDFGTAGFLEGVPGVTPSNRQFDGFSKLTGDDIEYGYNVGILLQPDGEEGPTRLGVSYRSKIEPTLEGRIKTRFPDFLDRESEKTNGKARIELPATLWLGAYHEINNRLALMVGATWTDWSAFEELRVKLDDGRRSVQPQNWNDSWRVSVGGRYRVNDRWMVRAGFEYDESPINEEDRTPRIPDQDRYWFTAGASYEHSGSLSVDFAYTYIYIDDYDIEDTELTTSSLFGVPVGNTLDGEYEADAHIVSVLARWVF